MMKLKLFVVIILTLFSLCFTFSACSSESNNEISSDGSSVDSESTDEIIDEPAPEPVISSEPEAAKTNTDSNVLSTSSAIVGVIDPAKLAISVTEETFLDAHGVQTIKKVYVLPFTADIADLAPKRMLVNGVEYAITDLTKSQSIVDKVHTIEKVAGSMEGAMEFDQKLEYSGLDGEGVLELDQSSVKADINNTTTLTHAKSAVKTYVMNIKDESQIPSSVVSDGVTLKLQSVTWAGNGDTGDSGDTYNTVAATFTATAKYSGNYNTATSDYKGTANYVGKILLTNSPTDTYTVIYKPSTSVSNPSGNYASNLRNKLYPQIDQENRDWQEAQFRDGVQDNMQTVQSDINDLNKKSREIARTSQVMFMAVLIVLVLMIVGVLAFVISSLLRKK